MGCFESSFATISGGGVCRNCARKASNRERIESKYASCGSLSTTLSSPSAISELMGTGSQV
jgi:hypothetical protein